MRQTKIFTLRDAQKTATEVKWHTSAEDAVFLYFGASITRTDLVKTVVIPACTVPRRPPVPAS